MARQICKTATAQNTGAYYAGAASGARTSRGRPAAVFGSIANSGVVAVHLDGVPYHWTLFAET